MAKKQHEYDMELREDALKLTPLGRKIADDLDKLEAELYKFADIKELRPKRKAMREAKAVIEEKYGVKLEELK